jgi:hypothetical protein
MVNTAGKRTFTVFFWIVAIQLAMPLLLLLGSTVLSTINTAFIERNSHREELFTEYRIAVNDPALVLTGKKEFSYYGHWYDARSIVRQGNYYICSAHPDKKETALRGFDSINGHSSGLTRSIKKLLPFFLLYHELPSQWRIFSMVVVISHNNSPPFFLTSPCLELTTPPPLACA